MPSKTDFRPVQHRSEGSSSRRLLKTWQSADLIRRMDEVILASRGGYADRAEFLAEAIWDRIEAEEEQTTAEEEGALPARLGARNGQSSTLASPTATEFGDWLQSNPPTLSASASDATTFGLHNRDYPTLWAADWIGRLTTASNKPLDWLRLSEIIIEEAWGFAEGLQALDLDRPRGAKVAAGFPTNRKKRDAVAARFREHFMGLVDRRGARGPMFTFGLAAVEDSDRVALTDAGVQLLGSLRNVGAASGPPFSEAAWNAFAAHLASYGPAELEMWLRVLAIIAEKPDRQSLIERCDWWSKAAADTNSMSYMARGREWGLVELSLDDGCYQLTERGAAELRTNR